MKKTLVLFSLLFLAQGASASLTLTIADNVIPGQPGFSDSPAYVKTSYYNGGGAISLILEYTTLGETKKISFDSATLKKMGFSASQLEEKILKAVNGGESRFLTIEMTQVVELLDDSYIAQDIKLTTLAASPSNL